MSKKILVIDDSRTVRQQVSIILGSKARFEVVSAEDGVDGLEELAKHPNTDLILCDINMPGMNGIEFVEAVRGQGNPVPIVMLTTETAGDLIKQAKKAGARAWIVKPFNPNQLIKAVEKLTGP